MGLLLDDFVIDGVKYPHLPETFRNAGEAIKAHRPLVNGQVIVADRSVKVAEDEIRFNSRKIATQVFIVSWNAAPYYMLDHLKSLWSNQKAFFIQYDAEQSFEYIRCHNVSGDQRMFFTPTYPIAPFQYTPVATTSHSSNVIIDDGITPIALTGDFTINNELGAILLGQALTDGNKVYAKYTWRCPVMIGELSYSPVDQVAKQFYDISLSFLQVPESYVLEDKWEDTEFPACHPSEGPTMTTTSESSVPISFRG